LTAGDVALDFALPEPAAEESGVRLRLVRLDVGQGEADRLAVLLSDDERRRAGQFARAADARRFIVRRGRLRELIAIELGCDPAEVQLASTTYGKPVSGDRSLGFNASSSADLALYAVARGREVGCDIEALRPELATAELAARYFSPVEQRLLADVAPERWSEAFFNCWTRKEALVKGLGLGLSYPLSSFDVSVAPGEPAKLLRGPPGWLIRSLVTPPGWRAAVALGPLSPT
jgi:4'-phosphopantetheinyl transferase